MIDFRDKIILIQKAEVMIYKLIASAGRIALFR
jgi:hypothetical protein